MEETKLFIDHCTRTVLVSKKFMKAAGTLHSNECRMIMDLRKSFPDYSIEIKAVPKAAPNLCTGLSYAFIESYIQMQDNRNELMEEFASLRMLGTNYPQIKRWFLNRFPEYTHSAA